MIPEVRTCSIPPDPYLTKPDISRERRGPVFPPGPVTTILVLWRLPVALRYKRLSSRYSVTSERYSGSVVTGFALQRRAVTRRVTGPVTGVETVGETDLIDYAALAALTGRSVGALRVMRSRGPASGAGRARPEVAP
jgi:hypothetical protein